MDKKFIFKGNISQITLPEVLKKIEHYKVPGVIIAKKNLVEKKIYLKNGKIIFASSNQANDRLGEFLLANNRITIEQYNLSAERIKESGKRQGRIFIELGVLTPKELFHYVQEQVKAIIWSVFNWRIGEISFQIGTFKEDELIKLSLDIPKAIYEGIKCLETGRFLLNRVGTRYSLCTPKPNGYVELSLLGATEEEKELYKLFDGKKPLYNIIEESILPFEQCAKLIYAFHVLELITTKETTPRFEFLKDQANHKENN